MYWSFSGRRIIDLIVIFVVMRRTNSDEQDAVRKGDSTTLGCPRRGASQQWRKDGAVIFDGSVATQSPKRFSVSNGAGDSWFNLTLTDAADADSGFYECVDVGGKMLASFKLTVLEAPQCAMKTPRSLTSGEVARFSCASEIPGVTLLWHVGEHGEKSVGSRDHNMTRRYRTKLGTVATAEMNGKYVFCELQHPAWHVLDGIINCKVGPLDVRYSLQIRCDESESVDPNANSVSCRLSANPPPQPPLRGLRWEVDRGNGFEPLGLEPRVDALEDPSEGFVVRTTLDGAEGLRDLVSLRLKAGEIYGEPIFLSPGRKSQSHSLFVVVVVIAVLIVVVVVVFLVVVVMYRKGRIFKPAQNIEIELEKTRDENRLLTQMEDKETPMTTTTTTTSAEDAGANNEV